MRKNGESRGGFTFGAVRAKGLSKARVLPKDKLAPMLEGLLTWFDLWMRVAPRTAKSGCATKMDFQRAAGR